MDESGYDLNLKRYKRFLQEKGYRESTVESYSSNIARYLEFVGTDKPTLKNFDEFKEAFLFDRHLSRSSINNYYCTIMQYHQMVGNEMKLPLLKNNVHLPFYFDEDDVNRIFAACRNLKHYAMLQTLFFGCLRASELCHLEDRDLDLKNHTIRIREGKGGKDGIALISEECACTLEQYLEVRPHANGSINLYSAPILIERGNIQASIECSRSIKERQEWISQEAVMFSHDIQPLL